MIIGNRTTLRAWKDQDLPILLAMRNNFALQQQLMAVPRSNSPEQVREWLSRRTKSSDSLLFVIAEKESDCAVGYLQVVGMEPTHGVGYFGICISPDAQGSGFGGEAITLLLGYLRDVLGLRKLMLEVLAQNDGALRLYKKLGFSQTGRMNKHFYLNQNYCDVILMERFIQP